MKLLLFFFLYYLKKYVIKFQSLIFHLRNCGINFTAEIYYIEIRPKGQLMQRYLVQGCEREARDRVAVQKKLKSV